MTLSVVARTGLVLLALLPACASLLGADFDRPANDLEEGGLPSVAAEGADPAERTVDGSRGDDGGRNGRGDDGGDPGSDGGGATCASGARDCIEGNRPRGCDQGEWREEEACSGATPVCAAGVCVVKCTNGSRDCLGETPRLCANSEWLPQSVCSNDTPFCAAGACVKCVEGSATCDAAGVKPLLCVNGKWESGGSVCQGNTPACDKGGCYLCTNGAIRCEGKAPFTCVNHAWRTDPLCGGPGNVCTGAGCAACPSKQADCDGNGTNGCEVTLGVAPNCTGCGQGVTVTCYADEDGDGYGSTVAKSFCGTACPPGWSSTSNDCDDKNKDAYPGQTNFFTSIPTAATTWDLNCDGKVEPALPLGVCSCEPGKFHTYANDATPCGQPQFQFNCYSLIGRWGTTCEDDGSTTVTRACR